MRENKTMAMNTDACQDTKVTGILNWSDYLTAIVESRSANGKRSDEIIRFLEEYEPEHKELGDHYYYIGAACGLAEAPGGIDYLREGLQNNPELNNDAGIMFLQEMYYLESDPFAKRQLSGRYSLPDKCRSFCGGEAILSEGNERAFEIICEICKLATTMNEQQIPTGMMFGHLVPGINIRLALDDMNIRGQQIIDALDYCDGDSQKLVNLIGWRNSDLCAYINKKTAERFCSSAETTKAYIAVTGGASFTTNRSFMNEDVDLVMDTTNVEKYLSSSVKKQTIDYSKMDIISGTSMDAGIKIAEAHGFTLVFKQPVICSGSDECQNEYQGLMINPKTLDILEFHSKDNDMRYGGCRIIVASKQKFHYGVRPSGNSTEFKDDSGFRLYECDYREGVFRNYETMDRNSQDLPDFEQYPMRGPVSLPIPNVINDCLLFAHQIIGGALGHLICEAHYSWIKFVNYLWLADRIGAFESKELKELYVSVIKHKYETAAKMFYWTFDLEETRLAIRLAFAYMRTPETEMKAYIAAMREAFVTENSNVCHPYGLEDFKEEDFIPTQADFDIIARLCNR